eukprot:CAMPEP_0203795418 /NCGR_PEP_ID=MMETSP0100_2-20121128/7215_1 /ASSEMBLY_ACC=CAM_ASM_000210 /TAXON_ID=96639 /ORGANISM=" , Strain NY0313808BC1" /LENGTH=255 /DNA_ID=CAMNT_0050699917 /DNA_START=1315 /DNA_END=2079 /DNA_ORIENTATION=+
MKFAIASLLALIPACTFGEDTWNYNWENLSAENSANIKLYCGKDSYDNNHTVSKSFTTSFSKNGIKITSNSKSMKDVITIFRRTCPQGTLELNESVIDIRNHHESGKSIFKDGVNVTGSSNEAFSIATFKYKTNGFVGDIKVNFGAVRFSDDVNTLSKIVVENGLATFNNVGRVGEFKAKCDNTEARYSKIVVKGTVNKVQKVTAFATQACAKVKVKDVIVVFVKQVQQVVDKAYVHHGRIHFRENSNTIVKEKL